MTPQEENSKIKMGSMHKNAVADEAKPSLYDTGSSNGTSNSNDGQQQPLQRPKTVIIVEEDDEEEDIIPGPSDYVKNGKAQKKGLDVSSNSLDLSNTQKYKRGAGVLASIQDLNLPADQFAAGCNLLQEAARGSIEGMKSVLKSHPRLSINFRDYDRRTALHVASSEGHLNVVRFLVEECNARINRSDRWGGSPLDDAHRHRHGKVAMYLRQLGAMTGSGDQATNLITAAAAGDVDEVNLILQLSNNKDSIINVGDYDKRTALHLAAGEGHAGVVQLLCDKGANPNVEDRWGGRPIDDAVRQNNTDIVDLLKSYGGSSGTKQISHAVDSSTRSTGESENTRRVRKFEDNNMTVDFNELEMIERIGSGAFGEIYKCRWRGTLVAAKCIKTAKIRRNWLVEHGMKKRRQHMNSSNHATPPSSRRNSRRFAHDDVSIGKELEDLEYEEQQMCQEDKDIALEDFRRETLILRTLRHPNICLLLAYSTTADYEVMISELMKCSLLDVFKANILQNRTMPLRTKITYAKQLALGMNYLHTCKPPVIHRDLKPANLLIDHHGTLKVADFGLAKVRPDPKPASASNKNDSGNNNSEDADEVDPFVMTGETGSYRFMAPEVYRREYYTETVDVYSYAMIFYYLLSGRPPWASEPGHKAVVMAAVNGERPTIPRDWDDRLTVLLKQCWDENYRLRPSFSTIIKRLDEYSQDVFKINPNDTPGTTQVVGTSCCCFTCCTGGGDRCCFTVDTSCGGRCAIM